MVIEITDSNFHKEVLEHDGKVLVDFWAPWCPPCKMQGPIIEKLAHLYPDVKITKINIDMFKHSANDYQVSSIPTILIFDKGKIVKRFESFQSIENLQKEINLKRRSK